MNRMGIQNWKFKMNRVLTFFTISLLLWTGVNGIIFLTSENAEASTGVDFNVTGVYYISGVESWDTITVKSTGQLVIPSGSTLNVINIYLEANSTFELSGGILNLQNDKPGGDVEFSGTCKKFDITSGSFLNMYGTDGENSMKSSHGGNVTFSITAYEGVEIDSSELTLTSGAGFSPEQPWSDGDLNGVISAGGNIEFNLNTLSSIDPLRIYNSKIICRAGDGGNAPNGQVPLECNQKGFGGGFTNGGDVTGDVGAGGQIIFDLDSANNLILIDSNISLTSGKGGTAGSSEYMDYGPQAGSGGGGYSGGDGSPGLSNTPGSEGGSISGNVGSGGDIDGDVNAKSIQFENTKLSVTSGTGGDAGDGGTTESSGGSGGGGYSAGGGGSYWHTEGGNGGTVSDDVGKGGNSLLDFNVDDRFTIEKSSITITAGDGGNAGNGGDVIGWEGAGAGGGGYSAGGGGGCGGAAGGEQGHDGGKGGIVSGNVGTGGALELLINTNEFSITNSDLYLTSGKGGDGGICGETTTMNDEGGPGAGGYSAGGGGADGLGHPVDGLGGQGGDVISKVGDGGDLTFYVNCPKSFDLSSTDILIIMGRCGNGSYSHGSTNSSGKSTGRNTAEGAKSITFPISFPPTIITDDVTTCYEDEYYSVKYIASDVDTATGHLSWSMNTNASFLTLNSVTGELYGTPANSDVGSYYVDINVADRDSGSDQHEFTLTVINVNDPPVFLDPPESLDIYTGEKYVLDFSRYVYDEDNDHSELILKTSSYYTEVTGMLITFIYPNDVLNENVEVTVSDGITTSEPHNIWMTISRLDYDAPTILGYSPKGSKVPITTDISIMFDEAMDQTSVENAFSITPRVYGDFTWVDNELIFNPNSDLEYKTKYRISLDDSASDAVGNYLEDRFSWEFTTGKFDTDNDAIPDYDDPDDDNDGLTDDEEQRIGTNPYEEDTDGDGLNDLDDPDPLNKTATGGNRKNAPSYIWLSIGTIIVLLTIIILFIYIIRRYKSPPVQNPEMQAYTRVRKPESTINLKPIAEPPPQARPKQTEYDPYYQPGYDAEPPQQYQQGYPRQPHYDGYHPGWDQSPQPQQPQQRPYYPVQGYPPQPRHSTQPRDYRYSKHPDEWDRY